MLKFWTVKCRYVTHVQWAKWSFTVHRWHVSEPGECSAICGPGEAKHVVSCVRPENGQDVKVDEVFCQKQSKPADSVPCVVDVCPIGWESKGEVKQKSTEIMFWFYIQLDQQSFLNRAGSCWGPGCRQTPNKILCMCGAPLSASAQRPVEMVNDFSTFLCLILLRRGLKVQTWLLLI